jgi:hypothetical protein
MTSQLLGTSDERRLMPDAPTPSVPTNAGASSRRFAIELPGTYSSQDPWEVTVPHEQLAALPQADKWLFKLASEINDCAESARGLVLGESDCVPADVETAKRIERRRLHRMLLAWFELRAESEAPYRDARMLLTGCVIDHANALRSQRAICDDAGRLAQDSAAEGAVLEASAMRAASLVAALYPSLGAAMLEAERLAQIRAAIEAAATSDKRTPWILIAAVWNGIEMSAVDPERWRKDWHERQQSLRP